MFDIYHKLSVILDKRERWLALFVLFLVIIVSSIEVLGVASIMPFMAILANPKFIQTNKILSYIYNFLGFQNNDAFLFFVGVCVLVMLVGSTFLKAFLVWIQNHFANLRNFSISSRLLSGYLQRPYSTFLTINSSKLISNMTGEVSRVVFGILYPSMRLISNSLIAILLFSLFVIVNPFAALGSVLLLGISYGSIYKFASRRLGMHGKILTEAGRARLKAVNEAFGGIKDVKISSLENFYIDKYRFQSLKLATHSTSAKSWREMPSFGMQALVFGGMMVLILYLLKTTSSLEKTIPILAVYALGGYKLMPALQEIYKQLAEIRYNYPALDIVYEEICSMRNVRSLYLINDNYEPLSFDNYFELRSVSFSYPNTDNLALNDISMRVIKNNTVGFVGRSGSGKTTTADILLGLLRPMQGGIYVDNQLINDESLKSWQMNIGYVPQQIFLTDDTISANIAFGIPNDKIDHSKVEKACKTANLHNFILNELPDGYETSVGERGVRLSGGQRQRIGIARALYHDPDILILDEATSALDNLTEKAVMEAVKMLGHKKTIIIVAHRLSTVQSCDSIFLFESGKIIASGSYDDLISTSAEFQEMALINQ